MFSWESKKNRDIPLKNISGIFAQTGGELAPEKSADGGVPLRWCEHRLHPAAISLSDVILPSLAPVKRSRAVRSGTGHPPLPRSSAGELRPSYGELGSFCPSRDELARWRTRDERRQRPPRRAATSCARPSSVAIFLETTVTSG